MNNFRDLKICLNKSKTYILHVSPLALKVGYLLDHIYIGRMQDAPKGHPHNVINLESRCLSVICLLKACY